MTKNMQCYGRILYVFLSARVSVFAAVMLGQSVLLCSQSTGVTWSYLTLVYLVKCSACGLAVTILLKRHNWNIQKHLSHPFRAFKNVFPKNTVTGSASENLSSSGILVVCRSLLSTFLNSYVKEFSSA